MKQKITRLIATVLFFILLIHNTIPAYAMEPNIPLGKDIKYYDPERDGYYGLLPLRYEAEKCDSYAEGVPRTMKDAYLPVLVFEDTIFVRTYDFVTISGTHMDFSNNSQVCILCTEQRKLYLFADKPTAVYTQGLPGDDDRFFASLEVQLTSAPKKIDDVLWIPLDDLAVIFDLVPSVQGEGDDIRYILFRAKRDALDILASLFNDAEQYVCDLSLWKDYGAELYSFTHTYLDGLLNKDPTSVKMLLKEMTLQDVWNHYDPMKDWTKMLADDVADMIVLAGADEAYKNAVESFSNSSEMLSLSQTVFQNRGRLTTAMVLPLMKKIRGTDAVMKLGRLIGQMEDPINAKALKDINNVSGVALTTFGAGLSYMGMLNAFENCDELGLDALESMLESGDFIHSDSNCIDALNKNLTEYKKNAKEFALGKLLREDGLRTASDFFGAGNVPLSVYKIVSVTFPTIKSGIDASRSIQDAMIAVPLQMDALDILQSTLSHLDGTCFTENEIEQAIVLAYGFLKVCYVTTRLADQSVSDTNADRDGINKRCDMLLREMAILSNAYTYDLMPSNLSTRMSEVTAAAPYQLVDYVIKMFFTVDGEVYEKNTKKPVYDAECAVINENNEIIGEFSDTPEGKFKVNIPVFNPEDILPLSQSAINVTVKLKFTSATVKGTGITQQEFIPGADNDIGIMYIGVEENLVRSACIGEYLGTEYVIPIPDGWNQLEGLEPLPVECLVYNYINSFAFYGGKLYFRCASDRAAAIFECNPDGTDIKELTRGEMGSLGYPSHTFVIQDGTLYYSNVSAGKDSRTIHKTIAIDLGTGESRTVIEGVNVIEKGVDDKALSFLLTWNYFYNNGYYYRLADIGSTTHALSIGIAGIERCESGKTKAVGIDAPYGTDVDDWEKIVEQNNGYITLEAVTQNYLYYSTYDWNNRVTEVIRVDISSKFEEQTVIGSMPVNAGQYFVWPDECWVK